PVGEPARVAPVHVYCGPSSSAAFSGETFAFARPAQAPSATTASHVDSLWALFTIRSPLSQSLSSRWFLKSALKFFAQLCDPLIRAVIQSRTVRGQELRRHSRTAADPNEVRTDLCDHGLMRLMHLIHHPVGKTGLLRGHDQARLVLVVTR